MRNVPSFFHALARYLWLAYPNTEATLSDERDENLKIQMKTSNNLQEEAIAKL